MQITTCNFNEHPIDFRTDAWVNATHIAKAFGKRPNDFLALPSTSDFIDALEEDLGVPTGKSGNTQVGEPDLPDSWDRPPGVFFTTRGNFACGRQQGTWMHPDLALEFARWCSPKFSLWCNRTIRKILAGETVGLPRRDRVPARAFSSITVDLLERLPGPYNAAVSPDELDLSLDVWSLDGLVRKGWAECLAGSYRRTEEGDYVIVSAEVRRLDSRAERKLPTLRPDADFLRAARRDVALLG